MGRVHPETYRDDAEGRMMSANTTIPSDVGPTSGFSVSVNTGSSMHGSGPFASANAVEGGLRPGPPGSMAGLHRLSGPRMRDEEEGAEQ